jgi:predicted lipid-binding transport protein (Tim44 family)
MLKEFTDALKLKSKDKAERVEGFCILFLFIGSLILSLGIGLSILNPKGISAIVAMVGALLAFISTIALVFVWFIREFKGE